MAPTTVAEVGKECISHLVIGDMLSTDILGTLLPPMSSWTSALLATATVSILPNLLLIFIPAKWFDSRGGEGSGRRRWFTINIANLLLCFAVAGLLGDVFLHIIPHLLGTHSHGHGDEGHGHGHGHEHGHNDEHGHAHGHNGVADLVQSCFAAVTGSGSAGHCDDHHDHHHDEDHHGDHHDHAGHDEHHHHEHHVMEHSDHHELHQHSHSHSHSHGDHDEDDHDHHDHHEHKHNASHSHAHTDVTAVAKDLFAILGVERSLVIQVVILLGFLVFFIADKAAKTVLGGNGHSHGHSHSHGHNEATEEKKASKGEVVDYSWTDKLTASGWLNLLADSMHNFTDGVAIGASFASGRGLAVATFLSVICHEIPHEVGDFSILVSSGLTKWQAISAQFVTAIAAFAGTFVGLLAKRHPVFEDLLLAFTSGGFVYIATIGALPKIVEEESSILQLIGEVIMFIAGVGLMVLVTFLEEM